MTPTRSARRCLGGVALAAVLLSAGPAPAHHSFAMFDGTKCLSIRGTVYKFSMSYPHSWVWLHVAKPDGGTDLWSFEGTDPASLRVAGWTPDAMKVGDTVSVRFNPLWDGRKGGRFQEATLADGHVISVKQGALTCPAHPAPGAGG